MRAHWLLLACVVLLFGCHESGSEWSYLNRELRNLSQDQGARRNSSPVQTFHIGENKEGNWRWSIYWPEARKLFWIEETTAGSLPNSLSIAAEWFDLETGLVNTREETGSSTYLVDETWARDQIAVATSGRTLRIPISVPDRARALGL